MPIYEYKCKKCEHTFEIIQKSTKEKEGLICPRCGAKETERVLSSFSSFGGSFCAPNSFS
ncbi:MAG: zinc ribbon domain-containing protein [Nitrospirae bacterium]|nr:zinc ribbon domain-containing protein [Nitrospirota bacterium]